MKNRKKYTHIIMSMSFPPEYWGASMWKTMYSVVFAYPEKPSRDESVAVTNFFRSFAFLIPCNSCKDHYKLLITTIPITPAVRSKTTLLNWLFKIHNRVNKKLGKPVVDRDGIIKEYESIKIEEIAPLETEGEAPQDPPVKKVKKPCNCKKKPIVNGKKILNQRGPRIQHR